MIILGLYSILQALFLPGFIVLFLLNLHKGITRTLFLSAALSLVINFFIVYLMTILELYNTTALFAIFLAEIATIIIFRKRAFSIFEWFPKKEYQWSKISLFQNPTLLHFSILFFILIVFVFYLSFFYHNLLTPFSYRDTILGFNLWAQNWYHGILPQYTFDYPQLLSAIWSITYVFLSTHYIQLFAKLISGLFPLLILLVIMDLALRKKQLAYFIGVLATGYLFYLCNFGQGNFVTADLPTAFLATVSLYLLLLNETKKSISTIYLGAVIAAGAALTKQSGLYFAFFYPVFCYMLILKEQKDFRASLKTMIFSYLIILLLLAPWYGYIELQILKGTLKPAYTGILLAHLDNSILHRPVICFRFVYPYIFGTVFGFVIFPITLIAGLISNRPFKNLFLTFVLPFILIWLFFFSYDARNLAIILPILGLLMGFGIEWLIQQGEKKLHYNKKREIQRYHLWVIICLAIVAILTFNYRYPRTQLLNKQIMLQTRIGLPRLNNYLYDFISDHPAKTVLTNIQYLTTLPLLKKNIFYNNLTSPKVIKRYLARKRPSLIIIGIPQLNDKLAIKAGVNQLFLSSPNITNKLHTKQYIQKTILPLLSKKYSVIKKTRYYWIIHCLKH